MSEYLEITVTDENDHERVVIVTDWTYHAGRAAWASAGEWAPDNPPEPAIVEDIEAEWSDTKKRLSDEEWDRYTEAIEEAILNNIEADSAGDDEPRED